jgi:NAD(P)H-hydrate epimerase
LDNDTGIAYDPCVQATITVAMGFPKTGSLYYPGKKNTGSLRIEDLEYSNDLVHEYAAANYLLSIDELKSLLPPRKPAGSKFDHGVAAMLCGSGGMTGSAALAAESALRTGCGMVHVASPASCIPVLSVKLTEAVLHDIAETAEQTAALDAFDAVMAQVGRANAVCIGPGLSHNPETAQLVRKLVASVNVPLVLDADGINAYKDHVYDLKQHMSTLCITPHKGEWERLFGVMPETPAAIADRLRAVAVEYAMTIVYKGYPTLVAASGGEIYFSPYGNSGMATAGCGDVLAGIITSLAAQGCTLPHAAVLGAFIHGTAGDAAAEKYTEYSMLASDVMHCIHEAIKKLSGN